MKSSGFSNIPQLYQYYRNFTQIHISVKQNTLDASNWIHVNNYTLRKYNMHLLPFKIRINIKNKDVLSSNILKFLEKLISIKKRHQYMFFFKYLLILCFTNVNKLSLQITATKYSNSLHLDLFQGQHIRERFITTRHSELVSVLDHEILTSS